MSCIRVDVQHERWILNVNNNGLNGRKGRRKNCKITNNPSPSRWSKERSPAAIRICIEYTLYTYYILTYVFCNKRCTSIHGGQFVMKSKRSFNAFSTPPHLKTCTLVCSANPFTYCFFDTSVFHPEDKKKLSQANSTHS